MDVWLIGCICALMISAAETAVVALLMHLSGEAEEQKKFEETRVRIRNFHSSRMRHEKWADTAKILDNIFIIIFPLGFTTFIFLYWAYYLTMHFDR